MRKPVCRKAMGDKVKVTYLRKKSKHEKTVTLKNAQGTTSVVKNADLDVLGATFKEVTETQKKDLNINYGLEVMKVNNGAFKEAGIAKGFIIQRANEQAVKTVDDLEKIVKEASTSKEPVVYIQGLYPTGKKKYFAVSLSEE